MNPINTAVQVEVQRQSPLLRYKASLIIIATGLVAIIGQLAASPDIAATGYGPYITALATILAALVNRFTKDRVTPSMGPRLTDAAKEVGPAAEGAMEPAAPVVEDTSGLIDGARAAELAGIPTANPEDAPLEGQGGSHRLTH